MLSDVKTAFRCTPALSFATKLLLSAFGNYSRILRLEEVIKTISKHITVNWPQKLKYTLWPLQLIIINLGEKPIRLDRELANLPEFSREVKLSAYVKRLTSPTTHFVHCDLLAKIKICSTVKARFDIQFERGNSFQMVSYNSSPQQVFRDFLTDPFVNSITLSVKDELGVFFDFNGFPLEFELEMN